jgi:hypothetical protein
LLFAAGERACRVGGHGGSREGLEDSAVSDF